jgi:hypothetical protein
LRDRSSDPAIQRHRCWQINELRVFDTNREQPVKHDRDARVLE